MMKFTDVNSIITEIRRFGTGCS